MLRGSQESGSGLGSLGDTTAYNAACIVYVQRSVYSAYYTTVCIVCTILLYGTATPSMSEMGLWRIDIGMRKPEETYTIFISEFMPNQPTPTRTNHSRQSRSHHHSRR